MKEGWKYASMRFGALYVATCGQLLMPVWFVESFNTRDLVSEHLPESSPTLTFISLTDTVSYTNAHFGQGTGSIYLDNVACTGTEERLINCSYNRDPADCSHTQDVGIHCEPRKYIARTTSCVFPLKSTVKNSLPIYL